MNGTVRINGGIKLTGEVEPIPNKNSVLAVLPACILTDKEVVYEKIPNTLDVEKLLEMMRLMGAKIKRRNGRVAINCSTMNSYKVDMALGSQIRASLMFVGPLLSRFGKAEIPLPGGCVLGFRSIAGHVRSFKKVGINVTIKKDRVIFEAPKKQRKNLSVWQLEASPTSTENLVMYLSGIEAESVIMDAASEPHVGDLLKLLQKMGAKVEGIGSNRLKIKGKKLLGGARFTVGPDFVDIAGYMVAAAVTNGKIVIKGANIPEIVDGLINWFELFGVRVVRREKDLIVSLARPLEIDLTNHEVPLAAPGLPKLSPRPWPGFPVDVIPVMATLACKTKGKLMLQNWMYESGLEFVRELSAMGANIFISDPQRVIIEGPVKFVGGEIMPPKVIQAAKAIFLAALADKAETTIHGVGILQRRYPNIFKEYRSLGANVEKC